MDLKEKNCDCKQENNLNPIYQHLYEDALIKSERAPGFLKDGLSVMLFECDASKPALDGKLVEKFFDMY